MTLEFQDMFLKIKICKLILLYAFNIVVSDFLFKTVYPCFLK